MQLPDLVNIVAKQKKSSKKNNKHYTSCISAGPMLAL